MKPKFSTTLCYIFFFLAIVMALLSHLYAGDGNLYEQRLTAITGIIFLLLSVKYYK